jgi:hypothetical protein
VFTFAAAQTANPWQDGRGTNASTGSLRQLPLGASSSINNGVQAVMRLGNHSYAGYSRTLEGDAQADARLWPALRLRHLAEEQYGRMSSVA